MISAISPIDGRYASKTKALQDFFSEEALIKFRIVVEVKYLEHLSTLGIISLSTDEIKVFNSIIDNYSATDAADVKSIERITNHDVKAVEYFIKKKVDGRVAQEHMEYIHFGLTSQDINNTAMPLMLKSGVKKVVLPKIKEVRDAIELMAKKYVQISLLARTHGQAASPTTLGKEMMVYVDRLNKQIRKIDSHQFEAKFGGATGNFNAHKLAFPNIDWPSSINMFISNLGLDRQQYTTQIDQYDNFAELFQILSRVNVILIDFAQDIWTYVSRDYFNQKVIANEVGSSAMPHKVNPIDFENAEGNMGMANAIFDFLSRKLPISRLQRDLTDSTVTRNIGVPLAHNLIAYSSLLKGMNKLEVNEHVIHNDLTASWAVVAEGIQTILRREGFDKPYELLKDFSRGKGKLQKDDFIEFINGLDVSDQIREELLSITPHNYIGYSNTFQ